MQNALERRLKRETSFKEPPIEQIMRPFQEFFRVEASSGIILLAATAIALIWANSPWAESYFALWEAKFSVLLGDFGPSKDLLHWINDGLMAVFFFVVGLEIKCEVLIGELSSAKKAALPIAAAIGGMLLPAVIYLAINFGTAGAAGWGIPMATDIAFALGVLALLGSRVPISLKIFLTALAIIDDLGAVLVIAIFYTEQIFWAWLLLGLAFFALMLLANRLGIRHPLVYGALGIVLWFCFLESGVHATIAGVLAALTIPARSRIDTDEFVHWSHDILHEFHDCCIDEDHNLKEPGRGQETTMSQRSLLQALETAIEHAQAPLQRLEHTLEYPVAYTIMPIFALANAGVVLGAGLADELTSRVSLGIIFGLLLGKQLGITLGAWLAVRSGLAEMPSGVTWRHIYGVSWLSGIGFTMSLFIGSLAFSGSELLDTAKIGILTASIIAGVVGYLILRGASPLKEEAGERTTRSSAGRKAQPAEG